VGESASFFFVLCESFVAEFDSFSLSLSAYERRGTRASSLDT